MAKLSPYLYFNGNCAEAMRFYKSCLGGDLRIMTYGEAPMECPSATKDKVMHAALQAGDLLLMASDTPDDPAEVGDNVQITIHCVNVAEVERLFDSLSKGGKVTVPLAESFFAQRFGMLSDRFGINWLLILEKAH